LELWHVPVLLDGGTALCGRPRVPALRRSFHPDDLLPELKAAGVDYTIITVEAADGKAENEALLANTRVHAWIAGVVGWLPLDLPVEMEKAIDALIGERAFVGVRHLVNVEPDPDWIVRHEVLEGLRVLAARGLVFDYVGILPRHLEHVPWLAEYIPDLRIVIDHIGKPPIAARGWEPWASLLARAVREPKRFQNAQRNYERYLALARAEAQLGNTVGGELLPVRRISFQIDARGLRTGVRDFAAMAACRWQPSVLRLSDMVSFSCFIGHRSLGCGAVFLGAAVVLPTLATWCAHELRRRVRVK
jgi:Amidohydrolase